jgi:hypothetical protein
MSRLVFMIQSFCPYGKHLAHVCEKSITRVREVSITRVRDVTHKDAAAGNWLLQ